MNVKYLFKKFLRENNALDGFARNLNQQKRISLDDFILYEIEDGSKEFIISHAFTWVETPEGATTWLDMSCRWYSYILNNPISDIKINNNITIL